MTMFQHKIMWFTIFLTFVMCIFLIYLLMTGSYISPLCLDKDYIECKNVNVGITVK